MAVRAVDRSFLERHRGHPQQLPERLIDDFLVETEPMKIGFVDGAPCDRSRRTCRIPPILALPSGSSPDGPCPGATRKYAGTRAVTHDSQPPSGRRCPRRPRRRRSGSHASRRPLVSSPIAVRADEGGRGRASGRVVYSGVCAAASLKPRDMASNSHIASSTREEGTVRMADPQYSPRDGQAFDVVLIGGGTGGYVAAIRAAQLGLDAVVIEIDKLRGHLPPSRLYPDQGVSKSADVYEEVQHQRSSASTSPGTSPSTTPRRWIGRTKSSMANTKASSISSIRSTRSR